MTVTLRPPRRRAAPDTTDTDVVGDRRGPAAPARRVRPRAAIRGYLYVVPAFLVFVVFLGAPLVQTVQYSFYNWNGIGTATVAGISNYLNVFDDDQLRASFLHAGVLILFYAAVPVVIALVLSAVISRAHAMRSMSFFRTVLFLPQVIATVVIGTIWISIYSQNGLLNQTLRAVGLDTLTRVWLGDHTFALIAIGLIGTWLNIGLCMVLFLSGIGNIAPELFEAARLDGAGRVREFVAITLPSLRGQIAVALTLTVVSALKTFDLVYITTRGGPGTATTVPAFEAYNRAFNTGQVGLASAIAVVLTIAIVTLTFLISRISPREAE
ncbi:carbohydrate ABC transporter permease [Mycolicibacterium cosmeticum]|uniref:ABC transporter permease n=1 Tax=Mycolicibacterium cosmeticum TaxID=258533 RepID=W9AL75_MYCCO|nr:sugar ABC transporter permease [Mycolicibacterium cosmeticum]CDO06218.1 ABC transporter permease [Mycolicibacterium cosmeticum]